MSQEKDIVVKVLKDLPASIFDDIPLPINCVDENGVIVIMNKAFIDYYGEPSFKSFIGKKLSAFDHSTRLPIILENGIPEIGMKHRFATGKTVTVDRIPIMDGNKIIGGIGIIVPEDIENMPQASQIRNSIIQAIRPDWKPTFETRSLLNNSRYRIDDIISKSSVIRHFKKRAESFAAIDLPVLISGESGVGKELFAHSVHQLSDRANKPFISINCSAIPETLLESELFGYESGAFTGASKDGKKGKFEMAHGGTIFLDEIGDLPLKMQAKLLRVLQESQIEKIGNPETIDIDVRVIAATNHNLLESIKNHEFRSDLYYRLNVLNLNVPPLRDRKEDIPLLIEHFRSLFFQKTGIYKNISEDVFQILENYHWPGNVRELKNIVFRLMVIAEGDTVTRDIVPDEIISEIMTGIAEGIDVEGIEKPDVTLNHILKNIEAKVIQDTLVICGQNKSRAADMLGIQRMTLYRKLKELGLEA